VAAPWRRWIGLTDAAARLGLSDSSFLGLAEREGISITHRGGRRGVVATELDDYLKRCQIRPGSYGAGSVPYKGRRSPLEAPHLDLLDAVVSGLSWSDARLAQELGVDADWIGRWRSSGVPNSYLPALRALREAASKVRLVGLDIASLLPSGSRSRLVQSREATRRSPVGRLMERVVTDPA
jgi:hypothetical protein